MSELCSICEGSGLRIVERADGVRAVSDCACRVMERRLRRLSAARIPERHRECTLETFTLKRGEPNGSLADARMKARGFVRAYPTETMGNGLLFAGPCGVGKTHLAVGLLQALILEREAVGLFVDCKELLKEIQSTYAAGNDKTERQVLRPALAADVLVLDELGAARRTEWVSDMIEHLLNMRYNDRKTTIITTNLPFASVGATGTGASEAMRKETLGDRIGERMFSRLSEMCVVVAMDGPDYRKSNSGRATFAPKAERHFRRAVPE